MILSIYGGDFVALSFGEKIKSARKSKQLTQRQLADKIGAAHNSISDWENDKNKPDPDTIELLCGVLEITPNYLLASSSEDFSPDEKLMIKKYRDLDDHGKDLVDTVLSKEHKRITQLQKATPVPATGAPLAFSDHLIANAAHDMNATPEQKANADRIMMDDDEWK